MHKAGFGWWTSWLFGDLTQLSCQLHHLQIVSMKNTNGKSYQCWFWLAEAVLRGNSILVKIWNKGKTRMRQFKSGNKYKIYFKVHKAFRDSFYSPHFTKSRKLVMFFFTFVFVTRHSFTKTPESFYASARKWKRCVGKPSFLHHFICVCVHSEHWDHRGATCTRAHQHIWTFPSVDQWVMPVAFLLLCILLPSLFKCIVTL